VNEDCSVKICDFGLARSIAGIESASLLKSKRFKDDDDHEMKSESAQEDIALKISEPAMLHHGDNVVKEGVEETK
jgi:hypothetical protein